MHNDLHPALRAYLLGLLDVRLGDLAGAAVRLADLGALPPEPTGLTGSLELELRAAIARAEGRSEEALTLLERPWPEALVSAHRRLAVLLARLAAVPSGRAVA